MGVGEHIEGVEGTGYVEELEAGEEDDGEFGGEWAFLLHDELVAVGVVFL